MKRATKAAKPPNAKYLEKALAWLDTASMEEALVFYRETHSAAGCDDWLLAGLGRDDLFFLLTHLLRRPDVAHPWLYARCREIEHGPDGHIDLWAREHYKSTIITFGLTIQDILRDPELTVGFFSHTRPIAKGFLRQVKMEFETNETLRTLYPDVLWANPKVDAPKWSEDEGIVVRRQGNPKEATLEAWGLVDGQPTSKHFKLVVYDDVVVRESVTTPDMITKTTTALEQSYSLGADGGVRRMAGTRWHFNDSYRTVLDRGTAKLRFYDGTEGNSGNIQRPVIWTPEKMAEKRRDMGPYTFGCQILQNPKADATHGFKREWLRYFTPNAGQRLTKYLLVDPASSKKDTADYTCMWVVGLGDDENYYVLDVIRDRLNLTERTERVIALHRKWKPLEVRYEEYGLQADIEHITSEQDRTNYRFKILKVGGRTAKPERIKRLIPMFEQGRVYLPNSLHVATADHEMFDMIREFVENEYMAFPVPAHDDMLDALSRIAEPDLPLKWPSKRTPMPFIPPWRPMDPGLGL